MRSRGVAISRRGCMTRLRAPRAARLALDPTQASHPFITHNTLCIRGSWVMLLLPRNLLVCVLVVSFLSSSLSQEYVCPTNKTANVNSTDNINFDPLPAGSPLRTTAEYNPGGLALWYNLASGVIDAARPGGLPYGEYTKRYNEFLQFSISLALFLKIITCI